LEFAYFQENYNQDAVEVKEAPLALLIPTWILVLANLGFGIFATFTANISKSTASLLFGGI